MLFKVGNSFAHFMFQRKAININASNASPEPQPEPQPQIDTFFITYVRKVIEAYELEDTDVTHYDYFAYERDNSQGYGVVVMLKEGSANKKPQIIGAYYYPATTKDYFYCVDYTGNAAGVDTWTRYYTTGGNINVGVAGIANVIYTTRDLYFSGSETPSHAAGVVTDAMTERFERVIAKLNAGQHAVLALLLPYLQKVIEHYSDELDAENPLSEYRFFAFERINNLGFAIGVVPKTQNPGYAYPYYYSNYYQTAGNKNYFLFCGYDGEITYMETTGTSTVNGLNNLFFTTTNIHYASSSTYKYCGYVDETIIARLQANGLLLATDTPQNHFLRWVRHLINYYSASSIAAATRLDATKDITEYDYFAYVKPSNNVFYVRIIPKYTEQNSGNRPSFYGSSYYYNPKAKKEYFVYIQMSGGGKSYGYETSYGASGIKTGLAYTTLPMYYNDEAIFEANYVNAENYATIKASGY